MKMNSFFKGSTLLLAVLFLFGFLPACKKLTDTNPDGDSVGTLKDSTNGNCLPMIVHGIFKVDSVLTDDNYVDIEVDVAIGGNFDISSDTINGFSFKKKGTVGEGINRIRLYASGKPVAAGANTFTINYGLSSCTFTINVFDLGLGTSLYTLGGSPGDCSISSLNGTYIVGQPMTALNTLEMTVNVNAVGTYMINGATINGVSFSSNGTFANPGIQNIILTASGTPAGNGTFTYPVTNLTTTCSFPVTYTTSITNAGFGLSGSPGICTGATVMGTYTAGTPLTGANKVVINVNVTSPGNYSITTPTVNGVSFSASGTFNLTGQNQVSLTGTGTPAAPGSFNVAVSGGGNTCGFTLVCN